MKAPRRIFIWGLLLLLLPAGWVLYHVKVLPWWMAKTTRDFLRSGEQFMLISIQPVHLQKLNPDPFHDFKVLGQVTITDAGERDALIEGVFSNFAPPGHDAGCHYPRHALRAVKGNRTMELTICFSCNNVHFRENGRRFWHQALRPTAKDFYNQTLRKHNLSVATEFYSVSQ